MSPTFKVRKAKDQDVDKIHTLLKPFWKRRLILERTPADLLHAIRQFYVAVHGTSIIGVISYHDYGKHLKEIRSLAVHDDYTRCGIGSRLVKTLIRALRKEDRPKIFVLSYSPVFFEKNGFIIVDKQTLPEKIWKDCNYCKNKGECGETALVFGR